MADGDTVAADQLRSLVDRIERLEDEKREVGDQLKEVFAEAKGAGFDVKILRQVLRLRKMQEHDRLEQEELLDVYKSALGMR
ncbi:MAG: DUF2312 domain-containing protein [Geminicoccaceae bacterium]